MNKKYTEIELVVDNQADQILAVKVDGNVRNGKALTPPTLADIYKIDNVMIGYKKDGSPCCIIINNMEYCWC